jgi:hypothetical protein
VLLYVVVVLQSRLHNFSKKVGLLIVTLDLFSLFTVMHLVLEAVFFESLAASEGVRKLCRAQSMEVKFVTPPTSKLRKSVALALLCLNEIAEINGSRPIVSSLGSHYWYRTL